jgi:hypothetical protein
VESNYVSTLSGNLYDIDPGFGIDMRLLPPLAMDDYLGAPYQAIILSFPISRKQSQKLKVVINYERICSSTQTDPPVLHYVDVYGSWLTGFWQENLQKIQDGNLDWVSVVNAKSIRIENHQRGLFELQLNDKPPREDLLYTKRIFRIDIYTGGYPDCKARYFVTSASYE